VHCAGKKDERSKHTIFKCKQCDLLCCVWWQMTNTASHKYGVERGNKMLGVSFPWFFFHFNPKHIQWVFALENCSVASCFRSQLSCSWRPAMLAMLPVKFAMSIYMDSTPSCIYFLKMLHCKIFYVRKFNIFIFWK
jgi:hypothetical protein